MQSRDPLKGLPGVGVAVVVKDDRGAVKDADFDCRTDVECKLRMAGIKVLEIEDRATPLLCLNVNLMSQHTYRVRVSLKLSSSESKWSRGTKLGYGTVADALNDVKEYVDEFVNDWLAVNGRSFPKRSSDRGKLVMACSTGKTLFSLRIVEKIALSGGLLAYATPSIALPRHFGPTSPRRQAQCRDPQGEVVPLFETVGQGVFHALKEAWNDWEEAPFHGGVQEAGGA